MVKILCGLGALIVAELLVIIWVADQIGAVNTIGLLILVAVLGVLIVKAQGIAAFRRLLIDLNDRRIPAATLADGALIAAAGVLLVVPGFLTDIAGLLLLLRPARTGIRHVVAARWSHRVVISRVSRTAPPERPQLPQ